MTAVLESRKYRSSLVTLVLIVGIMTIIVYTISLNDIHDKISNIHSHHTNNIPKVLQSDPDYSRLINISFSFLHLPLVCANDSPLFIVAVHTSPDYFEKRKAIRETWASKENNVKVLFMIGRVEDESIQNKIEEEFDAHKDFVQGDFLDSYHNLTYKHVMVLKYMIHHCPNAEYLVKLDDDVFVNMPNLKAFLHLYSMEHGNSSNILCSKMYGNPVLREGRWGVSLEEYPGTMYPNHCSGFAIIYPRDAVFRLYVEAQKARYFWIDDVHVTGTLAKSANITHTEIGKLILTTADVVNIVDFSFTNITKPFLFGRMNLDTHQIRTLWSFVSKYTPKVSILEYLE